MSPRDRSPVRNSSPRQPSGKDPWNQLSPYTLTLLQLEQTTGSSGRRGTGPPTEPGFFQGFFSILSLMEFWFLAVVASGLLSWGHFISSDITDLIAQMLFKLNWAGQWLTEYLCKKPVGFYSMSFAHQHFGVKGKHYLNKTVYLKKKILWGVFFVFRQTNKTCIFNKLHGCFNFFSFASVW